MKRFFCGFLFIVILSSCTTPITNGVKPGTREYSNILDAFPLAVGARWTYSAKISYQNPDDFEKLLTWSGTVTDSVVKEDSSNDGKTIFTLQEIMEPAPPEDVWRQPRMFTFVLSNNEVIEGSMRILKWPIKDKDTWPAFTSDNENDYQFYAGLDEKTETQSGIKSNCYYSSLWTGPDTSEYTFCPGIGFIHFAYNHHGTPQVEDLDLISFQKGNP